MRNLLALAAAVVIAFLGVGYFQGWYVFKRTPTEHGTKLELDVNSPKITEDLNKSKEKLRNWLNQPESGKTPATPQQIVTPASNLPSGTPTVFKTTEDGTIVFPSIPSPPPVQVQIPLPQITPPPGLPQR